MLGFKTPAQWAEHKTPGEWADHHMTMVIILIALGVFASYPVGVFVLDGLTAAGHARANAATPQVSPSIGGSGVVLARNDTTGTLSIQHAGVPGLGLKPGPTEFRASEAVLKQTDVGDQVDFKMAKEGDFYVVTSLQRQ